MAVTVKSILNRTAALLNDEEHVRWEEAELLEWLNDGQRVIARGPALDAYVVRDTISAAAGTVQSLPSDGLRLVDVIRDVVSGSAILNSDYAIVDTLRNTWRNDLEGIAEVYFYDSGNPTQFEVYPPQAGGEQIEIIYNAIPADARISGNIRISDVYADTLIDYVAYRAFSKDNEDTSADLRRATAFYNSFLVGAGMKDQVDAQVEPRSS